MMENELHFERNHSFGHEELFAKVMDLANEMEEEFHLTMSWASDYKSINFVSLGGMMKGLEGTLHIDTNRVRMVLRLPFGLRPMAGMIRTEVEDYLTRNIGE